MDRTRSCIKSVHTLALLLMPRCSWDTICSNLLGPAIGGNISGRGLTRRAAPAAAARAGALPGQ
ncbi:MAG TPA: hypothetical protein VMH22_14600 [bacterium]|nr:hypothetical protein [bacterium]